MTQDEVGDQTTWGLLSQDTRLYLMPMIMNGEHPAQIYVFKEYLVMKHCKSTILQFQKKEYLVICMNREYVNYIPMTLLKNSLGCSVHNGLEGKACPRKPQEKIAVVQVRDHGGLKLGKMRISKGIN